MVGGDVGLAAGLGQRITLDQADSFLKKGLLLSLPLVCCLSLALRCWLARAVCLFLLLASFCEGGVMVG